MTKPTEVDLLVLTLIVEYCSPAASLFQTCFPLTSSLYTPGQSHMLAQGLVSLMVVPGTTWHRSQASCWFLRLLTDGSSGSCHLVLWLDMADSGLLVSVVGEEGRVAGGDGRLLVKDGIPGPLLG